MMTLFNRKELMTVYSAQKLYALQAALDAAGIPYRTKIADGRDRFGGRGRGTPFQNPDMAHHFKMFVHRDDYDRALAAIQPVLRGE